MDHFIIIGTPKCGTTSLYQYLSEHPKTFLSKKKEPNYFRSALFDWRDEKKIRNRMRQYYLEFYARNKYLRGIVLKRYFKVCERKPGFLSGDGSVNYFHEKGMARRIHSYLPDAKLILMLRNPVDRVYSNFWMNVRQGVKEYQAETFDNFIEKGHWHSRINNYSENLCEWLNYFPLEQIFLIKSKDFFEKPQDILNELFDFLGIQRFVYAHRIRETPYAKEANSYPPMLEHTRRRLTKIFSCQQYKLFELTGKDFRWFSS